MKRLSLLLIGAIFLFSCSKEKKWSKEKFDDVLWKGALKTPGGDLPFYFYTMVNDSGFSVQINNGAERLMVNDARLTADSLSFRGHIFDSEIRAKIINDSVLEGEYVRLDTKEPYIIPFSAVRGKHKLFFSNPHKPNFDFTGKWETSFFGDGDTSKALGVFNQEGNDIYGTFMTPTGDYRYLNGQVNGQTMYLSTFDGAHAFLFKGVASENQTIKGGFWSGNHWYEEWFARRTDTFELPDPDSLTYLKEGAEGFSFSYVNESGEKVIRDKESFKGKVTIIQILGTWCPNCMDETNYLIQLNRELENVEVIGLAFEKAREKKYIDKRIKRFKKRMGVNYPIIYMGAASKEVASEAFPMLNKIISFPTTIVIDKEGEVRKIHTGFSGPGTENVYLKFTEEFNRFIQELSNE